MGQLPDDYSISQDGTIVRKEEEPRKSGGASVLIAILVVCISLIVIGVMVSKINDAYSYACSMRSRFEYPTWRSSNHKDNSTSYKEYTLALDYLDDEDYYGSEIVGIAISDKKHTLYLNADDAKNDKALLTLLKDENIKKYAFDYKAIKVNLHNQGIEINGLVFDLLIASYLLDSTLKNKPEPVLHFYGVDVSSKSDDVSLLFNENPQNTGELAYFSLDLAARAKAELVKVNALDLFNNLDKTQKMQVAKHATANITNKFTKKQKVEMKQLCMKPKQYIHYIGKWDKLLDEIRKEINNVN